MTNELKIKKLTASDFDEAAEVLRQSFATVIQQFDITRDNCPTNPAFASKAWLEKSALQGAVLFGCFCGEQLVGCVEVHQLNALNAADYELNRLAVLPAYRHRKIGHWLLDTVVHYVRERNGSCIKIGYIEENKKLKQWYLSYGFTFIGAARVHAQWPFTVGAMELDVAKVTLPITCYQLWDELFVR